VEDNEEGGIREMGKEIVGFRLMGVVSGVVESGVRPVGYNKGE
jgi:hypothetical protein